MVDKLKIRKVCLFTILLSFFWLNIWVKIIAVCSLLFLIFDETEDFQF
jgi:hypothetical protein